MRATRLIAGGCAGLLLASLSACQPATDPNPPVARAPDAAAPSAPPHTFGPEISTEDIAQHVRVLASDEFAANSSPSTT